MTQSHACIQEAPFEQEVRDLKPCPTCGRMATRQFCFSVEGKRLTICSGCQPHAVKIPIEVMDREDHLCDLWLEASLDWQEPFPLVRLHSRCPSQQPKGKKIWLAVMAFLSALHLKTVV